jgi:hypothetical protein
MVRGVPLSCTTLNGQWTARAFLTLPCASGTHWSHGSRSLASVEDEGRGGKGDADSKRRHQQRHQRDWPLVRIYYRRWCGYDHLVGGPPRPDGFRAAPDVDLSHLHLLQDGWRLSWLTFSADLPEFSPSFPGFLHYAILTQRLSSDHRC